MTMQPDVYAPDVRSGVLENIEKRIRELEQVRATKANGSWLYQMDTTVLEKLRAEREWLLSGLEGQCA